MSYTERMDAVSTSPRNPRYFPRMKVRGARRRRLAPVQRLSGAFDALTLTAQEVWASFDRINAAMKQKES